MSSVKKLGMQKFSLKFAANVFRARPNPMLLEMSAQLTTYVDECAEKINSQCMFVFASQVKKLNKLSTEGWHVNKSTALSAIC